MNLHCDTAAFHARLRRLTAAAHDRVEARFVAFERDPVSHLDTFLAAQLSALRALRLARTGHPCAEEGDSAAEQEAALEADLSERADQPVPRLAAEGGLHTLAVGYLVLGSRLGAQVLARKLTDAGLPLPRFFALHEPKGRWSAFRDRLNRIAPDGDEARAIARDACTGFELYEEAAAHAFGLLKGPPHDHGPQRLRQRA